MKPDSNKIGPGGTLACLIWDLRDDGRNMQRPVVFFKKEGAMLFTEEQRKQFQEAAKPLVKFLCDHCHPHVVAIVESTGAEIFGSAATVKIEEFLKD